MEVNESIYVDSSVGDNNLGTHTRKKRHKNAKDFKRYKRWIEKDIQKYIRRCHRLEKEKRIVNRISKIKYDTRKND